MMPTEPPAPPDYRPAGVFISYATEDHDIARAVYQSLQDLGETVFDRVKVFLDSKSMEGGDEIREDIRVNLKKSDFLIVLYTGVMKRSHYTGYEVGFFDALIQDEIRRDGQSGRKIISLYLEEPPTVTEDTLGISFKIDSQDLGGSREDYLRRSAESPDDPGDLGKLLHQIASKAESRLPPQLAEDREARELAERNRQRRKKRVAEQIIPTLKGKLFDCLGTRIMRRSIEQKMFEFDVPYSSAPAKPNSIPDDTKIIQNSGSFDIFGVSGGGKDSLTWKDFKNQIESRDGSSSIVLAIEDVLTSAISPFRPLENGQIIRSPVNDNIYRILVTRQMDFFNGRRIVHLYFIQALHHEDLGDPDTSLILGFINVAAKYRFIFLEQRSELSVESFSISDDLEILKKVKQLIHQLLLIEEEARRNGLDKPAAILTYFGSDPGRLEQVRRLQAQWFEHRKKLMASAERVLSSAINSSGFSDIRKEWLATLGQFRDASDEINSVVTTQALENLKSSFVSKHQV